jgi:hypothetical protein
MCSVFSSDIVENWYVEQMFIPYWVLANVNWVMCVFGGTQCCSWLRQWATSWKVTGLILYSVTGIFRWYPSSHTLAQESTQPVTEISTRYISLWVKAAGALGWQPGHLRVLTVLKSGSPNCLESLRACTGIGGGSVEPCVCKTSRHW